MKIEMKTNLEELKRIVTNAKLDGYATPIEVVDIMIQKLTNKIKFKKYSFSDIIDNLDWDEMRERLIGYYYDDYNKKWVVAVSPNMCYFVDRVVFGLFEKETRYHDDTVRDAIMQEDRVITASVVFKTDNDYVIVDKRVSTIFYNNEGEVNTSTTSSSNLSNIPISQVYNESCLFIKPRKVYAS